MTNPTIHAQDYPGQQVEIDTKLKPIKAEIQGRDAHALSLKIPFNHKHLVGNILQNGLWALGH